MNYVVVFAMQYLIYLLPTSSTCYASYCMIQPAVDKDCRISLKCVLITVQTINDNDMGQECNQRRNIGSTCEVR